MARKFRPAPGILTLTDCLDCLAFALIAAAFVFAQVGGAGLDVYAALESARA